MGSDLRCGGGLIHKACTAVRSVARPRFVLTRCKADLVAETSGAGARNVVVAVSNEEDEKKGGWGVRGYKNETFKLLDGWQQHYCT